ncbi:MAG TPA: DNA replication and repair protein RecF [Conexibacter sp.]|nr:DNA replication and repair protein RecF [Conexibacter sp.]
MRVVRLSLRNFRSYPSAEVELGAGLTVITGRNGAGKTNLLDALYFGCTGRSARTTNDRELVRFGEKVTRVEVTTEADDGRHELSVGFEAGEPKRLMADGVRVERLLDVAGRPLVSVFLPDRLELVKGTPSLRRAHVDQVVAALWPSRTTTRRAYAQALAQRNALLTRVRAGHASQASLPAWDRELARHGIALMADRAAAVDAVAGRFPVIAAELGLDGEPAVAYRPRSKATDPDGLAAELAERLPSDLERGFTQHGPHRDDLAMTRERRELRAYGSQGQQRLALLALLLAEREAIAATRDAVPVMLLDDVMSELDRERRGRLVELLRSVGQSVVTTTDIEHVPGGEGADVTRLRVEDGVVLADDAAETA